MATDIRKLARRLSRTPLFTLVAVLTLGVGIGANAAIFSVVYGILLKPLPFDAPDRLVGVWHTAPGLGLASGVNQGPATYFTYREEGRAFEDIGLWDDATVSVTGRGDPERVPALLVTDGTLPILGVRAAIGRRFSRQDDSPGGSTTVMLSYGYWQRKFGGRPDIIGQSIVVGGKPHEIIGVLPRDFKFLRANPSLLLPFQFNRTETQLGNFSYQGVARLKPGVTIAQANDDVARMIPLLFEKFPVPKGFTRKMFDDVRLGPDVHPLAKDATGDVDRVLWVIFGTVAVVLLIACANVANLFLVRAEGRQQELAVRSALGATRVRLATELLAESLALGLAGGIVGIGLTYAGIRTLVAVAPEGLPRLDEIAINGPVLLFTLGISIFAGLLFGLIPVARFTSGRIAGALKEGGRASSDGRERHRARSALVVAEVALALVLLIASGLMIRTFVALRNVPPGFERPEEVLTVRTSIPEAMMPNVDDAARTFERIAHQIERLPGVTSVGVSSSITMDGFDSNDPVFVEDRVEVAGKLPPLRRMKWVGSNYSETMGNRIVAGRTITWEDVTRHAPVVVVTENLAREYWKTPAGAIGRRLRRSTNEPWREVVGVVGDEHDEGTARKATTIIYWPLVVEHAFNDETQMPRSVSYAIRSKRLKSPTFLKEIQRAVWSVNPNLPLSHVRTLAAIQAESMAQTSFALVMLAIAAGVALVLGLVGIYAVIAYIAVQRTREVGIRMALGAQPAQVSGMFVRHGLVLAGVGLSVGLVAASVLTRLMSSLLFGVSPLDPLTYGGVSLLLIAIALLASYLPARRAARTDPMIALRADAQ